MPQKIFRKEIVVSEEHLDALRHVNNVNYVQWMQDVATEHSSINGWDTQRYLKSGTSWFARRHMIDYIFPAVLGDVLIAETWISEMKNVSSIRKYRFYRKSDQRLIATAETKWGFVNLSTGRPTKVLPEILESFTLMENHLDENDTFQ
ncbi:MAG: thioesterase family protein [Planctomycetia bacterium]|nr:thioesterase family protein [Planctomycetia bacterium]